MQNHKFIFVLTAPLRLSLRVPRVTTVGRATILTEASRIGNKSNWKNARNRGGINFKSFHLLPIHHRGDWWYWFYLHEHLMNVASALMYLCRVSLREALEKVFLNKLRLRFVSGIDGGSRNAISRWLNVISAITRARKHFGIPWASQSFINPAKV